MHCCCAENQQRDLHSSSTHTHTRTVRNTHTGAECVNQCVFGSKAQRHQLHQYYMCVFSGGRVCCCVSVRAGLSCGKRPSQSRAASEPPRSLRSSHGFNADTGRDTTALTRAPCTHNSSVQQEKQRKHGGGDGFCRDEIIPSGVCFPKKHSCTKRCFPSARKDSDL